MNIILYTIDCPKCLILEQKLKDKNIEYKTFKDKHKMIEMGFVQMPILEVDEELMTFREAVEWLKGDCK